MSSAKDPGKDPPSSPENQSPTKVQRPEQMLRRSDFAASSISTKRSFGLVPLSEFTGLDLPTNGQVLSRMFHIQDHSNVQKTVKFVASEVGNELKTIYDKVPCEIKRKDKIQTQLVKLHEEYQYANKSKDSNGMPNHAKGQQFVQNLDRLCDIIAQDAEAKIRTDRLRSNVQKETDLKISLIRSVLDTSL